MMLIKQRENVTVATVKKKIPVGEKGNRIGENHPMAKLSDEMVERIRDLRFDHELTYLQLAQMFGVSKSVIAGYCQFRRRAITPFGWKTLEIQDEDIQDD